MVEGRHSHGFPAKAAAVCFIWCTVQASGIGNCFGCGVLAWLAAHAAAGSLWCTVQTSGSCECLGDWRITGDASGDNRLRGYV